MSVSVRGMLVGVDGSEALVRLATAAEARMLRAQHEVQVQQRGRAMNGQPDGPFVYAADEHLRTTHADDGRVFVELGPRISYRDLPWRSQGNARMVYLVAPDGRMAQAGPLMRLDVENIRDDIDITSRGDLQQQRSLTVTLQTVTGTFMWNGPME